MTSEFLKNTAFAIPHAFEDLFGRNYTVPEKYFYMMLRGLLDRAQSVDGWIFFADLAGSAEGSSKNGFEAYGLSTRTCKSARKKLKEDGLIETRYVHSKKGYRIGTEYRLLDDKFIHAPKAIHWEIMSRLNGRLSVPLPSNKEKARVIEGIGAVDISNG